MKGGSSEARPGAHQQPSKNRRAGPRDWRLIRLREARGFVSMAGLTSAAGIPTSTGCKLETFELSPWSRRSQDWTQTAERVALALGMNCAEIWPWAEERGLRRQRAREEAAAADVHHRDLPRVATPEDLLAQADDLRALKQLLGALEPRLRDCLVRYFGLDGQEELTMAELGESFCTPVSAQRIWSLVARGVERLQQLAQGQEGPWSPEQRLAGQRLAGISKGKTRRREANRRRPIAAVTAPGAGRP
jgi:hypothetical protein